ncbi:hypothetical protein FRC12_001448 [Ceratobasidium sp. 428]|nr:hypothetical protein FRC12_001448 [Ceratobasidium sp. 428]
MGMTMLEIMTGDVPFREIQSGHMVILAVVNERRIPRVPELQSETAPPEAEIVHGILRWCWKYEPRERPTARKVAALMQEILSD